MHRLPTVRTARTAPWLLALLFLLAPGFSPFSPRTTAWTEDEVKGPDPGPIVESVCSQIEDREGTRFWALVQKLEGLGKDAVPALRSKLSKAGEKGRLACSKAILFLGDVEARGEAVSVLEELAQKATSKEIRVAAMETLGENGDPDQVLPVLEKIFDGTTDPAIVIPLARTLWEVDRVARARDKLIDLLGSQDLEVKQEAALALAEIDYFE